MKDLRILVLVCVSLGGMGQGVVAPKLPLLLGQSGNLALDSGLSASLMYLGVYLSTFLYGRVADQGKVHWLLAPGLSAYSVTLIALGLVTEKWFFFGVRFIEGLCLSAIFVSADFVLGRLSSSSERGRWLSYYGVAISMGLLLGPAMALGVSQWASSALVPLGIVAGLAGMMALFSLSLRVQTIRDSSQCAAAVEFTASNRGPLITAAAYGFLEAGLVASLPVLAVTFFHIVPEYGLIAVILSAALSSLLWGEASDRTSPRTTVFMLLGLMTLGPLACVFIFKGTPLFFWSCIVFGVLAGGLYPVGFSWLLSLLPESRFGEASGAFARAYGLGSLAGPLLLGLAVERWQMHGLGVAIAVLGLTAFLCTVRFIVPNQRS